MEEIRGWFSGRLPDEWFEGAPEVSIDREEIVVVGRLAGPGRGGSEGAARGAGGGGRGGSGGVRGVGGRAAVGGTEESGSAQRAAEAGRIKRFREGTRRQRMRLAD